MSRTVFPELKKWPILFWFLVLCLMISCGKKANPVAPVQIIPKAVEGLGYQVKGRSLTLLWAIPTENTDGSPLTDLKGFKLLKGTWPAKDYCLTCPDQFQDSLWIDLKGPELPGIQVEANQVMVTFDQLTPGRMILFQVLTLNKGETASEPSKTLKIAWDLPLMPPAQLKVKPLAAAVELSWDPSLALVDGSPAEDVEGYVLYRRQEKGPWTKVNEQPLTAANYRDENVQDGISYTYQVKALRRVYQGLLESEGSAEKTIAFTRKAPLPAVKELVAFPSAQGIQLRWQGLEEENITGYHVYRRTKEEKLPKRLTLEPLADTIFEDNKVIPGKVYYYSVSPVGGAPARQEGSRSREVEINFNP
jgi:hypothetical protein